MTNYYYILSSLPVLSLEGRPQEAALDEAIDLIERQCDQVDKQQIRWFYYRNECFNLIEYWQHLFGHIPHRPLRKPYLNKSERFKQIDENLEILPPFMREWYERERENLPHWSLNTIENEVQKQFFAAAEDLDAISFVPAYFSFEHQLRAYMASYHQSSYDFVNSEKVFSEDAIALQLKRRPLSFRKEDQLAYPFLEPLIKSLATKDPKQITRAVHEVLWERADQLAQGHYFDRIALMNYVAKLFLLYRREQLFQNQDEPRLQGLVKEAIQNINSHDQG